MAGHVYKLAELRERRMADASIVVEFGDGDDDKVVIPPIECWPDKMPATDDELYRAICGADAIDRYLAAGGTLRLLAAAFEDAQGVKRGKR